MEIFYCDRKCPIGKHCFIIKTKNSLKWPIQVLKKCVAKGGKDIVITIGKQ